MPNQNNTTPGASPFEIVTPSKAKKGGKTGLIIAILVVIFLILSVVAGVLLVRQQQNIQEKAAKVSNLCPGAEQCPYAKDPHHLWNCHPPDTDGTVKDYICDVAGKVSPCGPAQTQFCCPVSGGAWTADMTVCNKLAGTNQTPTPTPTSAATTPTPTPVTTATPTPTSAGSVSTPTPTPVVTPTPTPVTGLATPTPLSTTSAQTSPLPIPVTGVNWPTAAGIGIGAAAIIISILVAL